MTWVQVETLVATAPEFQALFKCHLGSSAFRCSFLRKRCCSFYILHRHSVSLVETVEFCCFASSKIFEHTSTVSRSKSIMYRFGFVSHRSALHCFHTILGKL